MRLLYIGERGGLLLTPKEKIMAIPADCTHAIARYSVNGEVHTIEGHPGDLFVQLDLLVDLVAGFKFLGAEPAPEPEPDLGRHGSVPFGETLRGHIDPEAWNFSTGQPIPLHERNQTR